MPLTCISSLYMLDIKILSYTWFTNIFSHFVACFLILLMVSFAVQEIPSFDAVPLAYFYCCHYFWCQSSSRPTSRVLLSMFSFRKFMVSCFAFKSLIHFQLIFVYGVRQQSSFILSHSFPVFPASFIWRDCLLCIVYSFLLCHRLIACINGGFTYGLYISLTYVSVFMLASFCSDHYSL